MPEMSSFEWYTTRYGCSTKPKRDFEVQTQGHVVGPGHMVTLTLKVVNIIFVIQTLESITMQNFIENGLCLDTFWGFQSWRPYIFATLYTSIIILFKARFESDRKYQKNSKFSTLKNTPKIKLFRFTISETGKFFEFT